MFCECISKYELQYKNEVEVIIQFINEEFDKDWKRLPHIILKAFSSNSFMFQEVISSL